MIDPADGGDRSMSAIRTEGLSKRYGSTLALDGLDLAVEPGEVYGYLGPNGAGKTTTTRLLLGLHRPSAGRAELHGVDAWRDPVAAHRRVAYFLLFVLTISLFACSQIAAARREEAEQQLETLFALPVSRLGWLGGRLLLAAGGAAAIALTAALFAWAGAASQNAGVSLPRLLEAGVNCLPAALLFLAFAALAFAVVPRASAGIAYGLVTIAFVWQLFGALLGAPHWLLDLSPFQHVGLVPAQPFRATAAAVMLALAAVAALAALTAFRRRDLAGA